MDEQGRFRREKDALNKGGGIRAPGESSASGITPPLDSPTVVDVPGRKPSGSPPTPRRISSDAPTAAGGSSATRPGYSSSPYVGSPILDTGSVLAQRYEILHILGVGGMGAVYQARDLELSRLVALKVIRPDLSGNQGIIDRFKQELILATQVTHRNVVRIYDLGEAEGMKFITMEFVEGEDLRSLIHERTKLPPAEAVEIMRQVCRALEAAHAVGVIHRDLKPQNIMRDKAGRVVVMDFGLARTLEGDGMTQSGALVGTMEYMSPEQALAKDLDQRTDIFSLGVIFYELLTGAMPFRADSALASLIKRTQERVVPVSELDNTIPAPLSLIVSRCLERDLALRYQTAAEVLADLDAWSGNRPLTVIQPRPDLLERQTERRKPWLLPVFITSLLVLFTGGYAAYRHFLAPSSATQTASGPAAKLAIVPLHNASGDPKLDWLGSYLADMLNTDVGQSAKLQTISSDRMHQVLSDLQVTNGAAIDPDTLRHIVEMSTADVIVSGQYERLGDQIQIDATVRDPKQDRSVAIKATAASDKELPAAIDALADQIRKNLSLSSNVIKELKAQAFTPSSQSIDALRDYNQGMQLKREGRNIEAGKLFSSAIAADPQFALAYSALGETQFALGYEGDAEQSSRRAVQLADNENLPLTEKYLISASHDFIIKDNKKALQTYETLAQSMPGNVDVQYALGTLYSATGNYAKARDQFAKILQAEPKNIPALWQSGIVEFQSDHPQAALDPLSKGLILAIQSDNQEQHGLILLSMGIAYQLLHKPDEALRNYNESIAINEKLGQKRAVASALAETAQMQIGMGEPDAALATSKKVLALFQEIGMKKETGDTLIDMASLYQDRGDSDQALQLFKQALQIERDAGDENYQSLCLSSIASIYLAKGDTESAFTYYQQALQLGEKLGVPQRIADPLGGLGETYTKTGEYDQALSSLKRALDIWRSAREDLGAASVQRQMGVVFGYQARFGAAVASIQDAVKAFEKIGEKSADSAEALQNLAEALARAGRGDEAAQPLSQAESIARDLKNDSLLSTIEATRGDIALYRGDLSAAAQSYQRESQFAAHTTNRDLVLQAKLNLGRVAIAQGRAAEAVRLLRPVVENPDTSDKSIGLHYSVTLAEALIQAKDYARARQLLQEAIGPAEKSGMRLLAARIYYMLGTAARLSGNSTEAWTQYRQSLTLLNAVRNEPGAENILRRTDLKAIYDECNRWVGVDATSSSK